MKFIKKDRIYIPSKKSDYFMGCMGLEDPFPARIYYPKLSKKSILTPGSLSPSASPSAICSSTSFDFQSAAGEYYNVGSYDYVMILAQGKYDPPANAIVCKLDLYVYYETGNADAYIYNAIVAKMSGSNLDLTTLNTTYALSDDVSGATLHSLGLKTFTFSTPFVISDGTLYAVGIKVNTQSAAYYHFDAASDAADVWKVAKSGEITGFYADGTLGHEWTGSNLRFSIYGME